MQRRHLSFLPKLRGLIDEPLGNVLLARCRREDFSIEALRELLMALLEAEHDATRQFCVAWLCAPSALSSENRARTAAVAAAVLECMPDPMLSNWWPNILRDEELAKEILSKFADRHFHSAGVLALRVSEREAADLYVWVLEKYPKADDPGKSETCFVRQYDAVVEFRDGLLRALAERGSTAAVREIERLSKLLPNDSSLKWAKIRARNTMLAATWQPPAVSDLISLCRDADRRIVETGDQLLEVVIESLGRWDALLQGTPPAAPGLWDGNQPKSEDAFSNAAIIHLRQDLANRGIVLNREVVIRPGEKPGGKGERTDILVEAVRQDEFGEPYRRVSVIVEAKGCWNPGLRTDIREQLAERYLKDNECQHGLYLVGWFFCPQWDKTDSRYRTSPKVEVSEIRRDLSKTASELSTDGRVIRVLVVRSGLR